MSRFLRQNGLSVFFLAIFLLALAFQTLAGWQDYNTDQLRHGDERVSYGAYLFSSEFGQALLENWQSEYLQFTLYILATVWLLQRGSPESKELDKTGGESDQEQKVGEHAHEHSPSWAKAGGLRTRVYSNSLVIVMIAIWLGSWFGQSVTGRSSHNAERLGHQQDPLSYVEYLRSANFWENTLQNWQSEFLAVGSMAIFAASPARSPKSEPGWGGSPPRGDGANDVTRTEPTNTRAQHVKAQRERARRDQVDDA